MGMRSGSRWRCRTPGWVLGSGCAAGAIARRRRRRRLGLASALPLRCLWLWLWLWLPAFDVRAVKRAEHRRAAGPKSSPCLSAASLGCVTVKVTMCPVDREAQGPAAASCGGSRPAKGLFGSFLVLQKGTRTRSGRKLCTCFVCLSCVATPNREEQSFRAVRAAYFCLVKSKHDSAKRWRTAKPARRASAGGASQTAIAGHSPMR